ncbi:RICIN domain-containing protein [Saccharothrix stipae]
MVVKPQPGGSGFGVPVVGLVAGHGEQNVKQWNWDGSTNLQWQLVDAGGGFVRIVNRTSGMVADSWGDATNGAPVRQAP